MTKNNQTKPPLESLSCVNSSCDLVGQAGQNNLIIRRVYGKDQIRYLRCRTCQTEFSERKGTPLWNTKIREAKAISVAEHLSEGNNLKSTARLVKVDPSTVRRLCREIGKHAKAFHNEKATEIIADVLQADERWGFVANKESQVWEAEVIDPATKFVISHVQGARNGEMIKELLSDCVGRLANPQGVCLFTDGFKSYATHFPKIFGVNESRCSCQPDRYRIPRNLAHVQVQKVMAGKRLKAVKYIYRHGTHKRAQDALLSLSHTTPNTSIIERRNLTARSMDASQGRKTMAFARHKLTKFSLGWWTTTVYNWCRENRMLKKPIRRPTDKKNIFRGHPRWRLA